MRLEEYWGVGPKTSERLEEALGTERAVDAIESAEVGTLVSAGLPRGRATRILRRANGGEGLSVLSTRDTRAVYKELLDVASDYAVTADAADSVRVLTPLRSVEAAERRLDRVMAAVESWEALDPEARREVVVAFEEHADDESAGPDEAAVRTALALQEAGVADTAGSAFDRVADVDGEDLSAAAEALADLEGGSVAEGVDDELDSLRETLEKAEDLAWDTGDAVEQVRQEARGGAEFQDVVVDYVSSQTDAGYQRVREATPDDAVDASDFVGATLRQLTTDLREGVEQREATVAERLDDRLAETRDAVDAARAAVEDLALDLSLARFAVDFDCTRPEFVDSGLAVKRARNVFLTADAGTDAADADAVQPITYAVGDHEIPGGKSPPSGDRVAVLTGANSGGKTTLLETCCQVALLAQMGLPVPADHAQVSISEDVVFHRRHASFNAGVLESTLRTIVPPLTDGSNTLMLVDEFEAITEPGSAADLLHGLVRLTVESGAIGVFVTHLAEDLKPLPEKARKDGIFAEGLDADLNLAVDYQPRFGTVGKSTPEFIVSRLLAESDDRGERAGFETLARAVGEEAVQRTLDEWGGEADVTGDD